MLRTDELDYPLPEERIATTPAEPRDSSRMLVLRLSSDRIEHRHVRDLPEYLRAGDALVFNTTSVTPARLLGVREGTGGQVEGLYLQDVGPREWLVMLRGRGRLKAGQRIILLGADGQPGDRAIELIDRRRDEWIVRLVGTGDADAALDAIGRTPLPPYILRARGEQVVPDEKDRAWYQTIYADPNRRHSVAAPTAGLHFTPQLLSELASRGVRRLELTLHVGPGTFKPITTPTLGEHRMHAERFEVPAATITALTERRQRRSKDRIIAVGTTSVRALESLPEVLDNRGPIGGETDLLISPPFPFRHVDGLLTNFHLPKSTLLALVAAMVGLDRLKAVYAEAVAQRYRFYSYGDAMLILP